MRPERRNQCTDGSTGPVAIMNYYSRDSGYLNATSTYICRLGAVCAGESRSMSGVIGAKTSRTQLLGR